jgi:hypothetical protein
MSPAMGPAMSEPQGATILPIRPNGERPAFHVPGSRPDQGRIKDSSSKEHTS